MRSRIIKFLAIVSLTLCAAVLVSWATSFFRSDRVGWAGWRDEASGDWLGFGVRADRNQLMFHTFRGTCRIVDPGAIGGDGNVPPQAYWHTCDPGPIYRPPNAGLLRRAGFRAEVIPVQTPPYPTCTLYLLALPHAALVFALGLLPAVRWRSRVWRAVSAWRRRPGTCRACGYTLGETPDHCPACGVLQSPRGFDCGIARA